MSIASRRRAIIGVQRAGGGIAISEIPSGTGIKIGTDMWILVRKGPDFVEILRDYTLPNRRAMYPEAPAIVTYVDSNVDVFLTTTFSSSLPAHVQSALYQHTINCITYDGSVSGVASVSRSIYELSESDLSNGSDIVNALVDYYSAANNNAARAAHRESDDAPVTWWLRDAYTGNINRIRTVTESGTVLYQPVTVTRYVRPAMSLSSSTTVSLIDGVYSL